MLEVRLIKNKEESEQVFDIRKRVFTEEQGISSELDRDGEDPNSDQVIALLDNQAIGCGRIRHLDNKAKFERLAVLKEFRGKGYGQEILNSMVNYSKSLEFSEIYLDAQYHTKDFYKRQGFKIRGEPFQEVGIKHIEMFMDL